MVERALQRGLFQLQLVKLLRVHGRFMRLIPDAQHLVALRKIFIGNGSREPVGEFVFKAVAVVALGLELFSVQLGKLFDGVDIVVGIAAGGKFKFSRIERLQLRTRFVRQTAQAHGIAAFGRVGTDGLNGLAQIAGPGGVEIDLAAAPRRMLGQALPRPSKLAEII